MDSDIGAAENIGIAESIASAKPARRRVPTRLVNEIRERINIAGEKIECVAGELGFSMVAIYQVARGLRHEKVPLSQRMVDWIAERVATGQPLPEATRKRQWHRRKP